MNRRPLFLPLTAHLALAFLLFPGDSRAAGVTRTGEVYLFRGLANVFSTGMDEIGREMKARGMDVRVSNHTTWQIHASDIVARSKTRGGISHPVIIMGHSFGADCSIKMANYLGSRGIKVAYVATFDPTHHAAVERNVSQVQNFYVSGAAGTDSNRYIRKGSGFQGRLENMNLGARQEFASVHHFNIEKDPRLQQQVVAKAFALTSRKRS